MSKGTFNFESVQISRSQPVYRQISDRIRALIMSGELKAGQKLPSTQELAATLGSDPATIQTAMSPLVKEGLITRHPRRGTFVREKQEVLTHMGVFFGGSFRNASAYQHSLFGALEDLLRTENLRYKVFVDPRPTEEQVDTLPELAKSIQQREIQALLGVRMDRRNFQWLRRLPIASGFHVSGKEHGIVSSDLAQFPRLALENLRDQGCRSVGALVPFPSEREPRFGGGSYDDFMLSFTDISRDFGLTIRDEWVRIPDRPVDGTDPLQLFGCEQFKALWQLPERPDGLVVFPDSVVVGTILAMAELGVSVPRDLRVVFHRNKLVDILCPFPATWIQSDETQVAAALLDQIRKQLRGEPALAFNVPFSLVSPAGPRP